MLTYRRRCGAGASNIKVQAGQLKGVGRGWPNVRKIERARRASDGWNLSAVFKPKKVTG